MFGPIHVMVLVLLGLGLSVQGGPWDKLQRKSDENRVPGRYIVMLTPGKNIDAFLDRHRAAKPSPFENCTIMNVYRKVLNGFSAKLTTRGLQKFLDMEEVSVVEEDGVVRAHQSIPGSWGIDRVNQRSLPLDDQATFKGNGSGVSVYVIDTGITPTNPYFGGRAHAAYDYGSQEGIDCNGHGTHCAGTIGADSFGIARGVELYGVRVLNCQGRGTNSDIIEGLEWVYENAHKPAIASMSLGGDMSAALDEAVESLIDAGILVSAAAGNAHINACDHSPARVTKAVTVGATDANDWPADFSNYGSCVDIFAPGVDITSTWNYGSPAIETLSGTSMACPHVTGAAAIALGNNSTLSPAQIKQQILDDATTDVFLDTHGHGSPNRLLFIQSAAAEHANYYVLIHVVFSSISTAFYLL